ncbi:UNVERIFIED_CONTAM: hypothetical protein E7W76_11435 [Cronobacter sakazakii]|uniref:Uncharacterized protein n=1 Tax=Cronobacter sakazakii (strain ATCC BAA-894) TaxID=290339 RepID=A7MJL2_CROS8|nr:hypothetical protein ESA_01242 [Cronobacter sakazakii ATCC BAA-894]
MKERPVTLPGVFFSPSILQQINDILLLSRRQSVKNGHTFNIRAAWYYLSRLTFTLLHPVEPLSVQGV